MTPVNLQIVQHLRPGGIETMALELQRHLPGQDVHVVSLEGSLENAVASWPRLETLGDRLHFLDKKPGVSSSAIWRLYKLIRHLDAQSIHTHHIGPLMYGGIAARMAGVARHVHTEHDAWHLENRKSARLQRQLVARLKPTMVADCKMVARQAQGVLGGDMPHVILNGIDTRRFYPGDFATQARSRAVLGLPEKSLLVGCAARLEEVKGLPYLIEAFTFLPSDCHLALAGQGSLRTSLEELVRVNGLSGRVHFLGNLDDMPVFYHAIDAFCLPSLREGFPLSPLEAQACGVPSIVTEVGGAAETVCPDASIVVPPGDVRALAEGIMAGLRNRETSSVRAFVVNTCDIEKMCRSYSALLVA